MATPLNWEDYFMAVAMLSAKRSKDPATKVGACIVSPEKKIVGVGHNTIPNDIEHDDLPWLNKYVCHAALNAIVNSNAADLRRCSLYVTGFPCNECIKLIIQSGITEIVYLLDGHCGSNSNETSKYMLQIANINIRQFENRNINMTLNFREH